MNKVKHGLSEHYFTTGSVDERKLDKVLNLKGFQGGMSERIIIREESQQRKHSKARPYGAF